MSAEMVAPTKTVTIYALTGPDSGQECTGLPAEAFVLPERFLEEQPNFLRKYRRKGKGGQP